MADKVLLVKFGEIAMRGDNQYIFINRLILAIRKSGPCGKLLCCKRTRSSDC